MLLELMGLYLQGLLLATVTALVAMVFWLGYRAYKKLDKTIAQRQQLLYEAFLMSLMTIPVLAFAFMAILLMMKA